MSLAASGPLGIYGIVEKVVMEPNETSPERIQLWGAFSYVEGAMPDGLLVVSGAQRGYLYFKLHSYRPGAPSDAELTAIRREWRDLKAMAGTGQAVGFGQWPGGVRQSPPSVILGPALRGTEADFRVRAASDAPSAPAPYLINPVGIVKLSDQGANGWIVKQLRDALKR